MSNLLQKVQFLSEPISYGRLNEHVDVRETHMSWLFITTHFVYKLKKPVKYTFLDFSTLDKREFYCQEEFRLNRRLASDTYIDVVPLCCKPSGQLTLSNEGRIIDWLVKMRRLPEVLMLDARIRHGSVKRSEIRGIGKILATFYAGQRLEAAKSGDNGRYFEHEQVINRSVLQQPEFDLPGAVVTSLDCVDHALISLKPLLNSRVLQGEIVEGHGDLRPEHVCLTEPPQIIDCLEFNQAMRIVDPYDEVNYLGLECDLLGANWIRSLLFDILARTLGNPPNAQLMAFYGAFRALLRARLCLAHLLDSPVRHPEKWRPLALSYIAAAQKECFQLKRSSGRTQTFSAVE